MAKRKHTGIQALAKSITEDFGGQAIYTFEEIKFKTNSRPHADIRADIAKIDGRKWVNTFWVGDQEVTVVHIEDDGSTTAFWTRELQRGELTLEAFNQWHSGRLAVLSTAAKRILGTSKNVQVLYGEPNMREYLPPHVRARLETVEKLTGKMKFTIPGGTP